MFTPDPSGRVRNTLLVTGRGTHLGYDKIHLFDAFGFTESATVAPGETPVLVEVDGVALGLATCYDLRFPELFRHLAAEGAAAVLVAASWGAGEGKREQWELLARARALDSTAWVLACGQADPAASGLDYGATAPTGVGHSVVVDPAGRRGRPGLHRPRGPGLGRVSGVGRVSVVISPVAGGAAGPA
jgi:predicted amidohydrolase